MRFLNGFSGAALADFFLAAMRLNAAPGFPLPMDCQFLRWLSKLAPPANGVGLACFADGMMTQSESISSMNRLGSAWINCPHLYRVKA